jgi:hypothetical protein
LAERRINIDWYFSKIGLLNPRKTSKFDISSKKRLRRRFCDKRTKRGPFIDMPDQYWNSVMAREVVGYGGLIEQYQLAARPPALVCVVDSAVRGRRTVDQHGLEIREFQPSYRPEPTLFGNLQFALRYEGLNLAVC